MAKDIFRGPLEKVDECCYRIPRSYKPGMRVDGLIFADERLLGQIKLDQAPDQVANVAFLPGIQHASLAMPDIHWGYGFCIGGVCATDPDEGGIICPGGIGFDINCCTYDTCIIHEHGYTRRIGEMAGVWRDAELSCFRLGESRRESTRACRWFGQRPRRPVLRVRTTSGDEIRATADHPFWTPRGMVPVEQLRPGDRVAVAPFQGVPYEPPSEDILVSEADIEAKSCALQKGARGNGLRQVLNFLNGLGLLPLRYSSPALPYLCKILGFAFGDGHLHFGGGTGKGVVAFWGDRENLEMIRADVARLGVTPSRIYERPRHHHMKTRYSEHEFERVEEWFKVAGSGFALLLACLGAPVGKKTHQDYTAPAWLEKAPLWQKRLFLAAFCGAEMSTPATITDHGTVFTQPTIGMNKIPACLESGRQFLRQLSAWFAQFGVETQSILHEPSEQKEGEDRAERLRLLLPGKLESVLNLWARVGYEYNRERSGLAALAVQYLKHKQRHLGERKADVESIAAMIREGKPHHEILRASPSHGIYQGIERSVFLDRDYIPRVGKDYPTFERFCETARVGSENSGMVWEPIASIEPVDHDGEVYDFTVEHPDHNFIANGFVVSNCGVRLVRSNLSYREVKNHLRPLVDALFRNIPTGAGRSGRYEFRGAEMHRLLTEGAPYVVGKGLGDARDVECAEANGRLDGADPAAVSELAQARGAEQCGTLGSGNHFLEVQIVDHVFDEEAAEVMGLEKDMVCVMIHSGSRGLGYQVCDDALASLRKAPEKYGIDLPDRQLACAPVDSPEGKKYIAAMRAAANFAWCNRQLLMHQAREVFASVFGRSWQELQMNLIYDVCHNIAKFEEHTLGSKLKRLWVHRKGATRAFPPDHPEIPARYRKIGQPVIIPGDMGRASWVLVGQPGSMERTFGTTCHGAGRAMSRTASVRDAAGRRIDKELEARGVIARAQSRKGLAEEQPKAYKNVDEVVDVVDRAGLSKKVARMRPIGVIKG
jgi:tRNA-splicing ligase RtcB (3'-phosphate/5'-hydroxy nucleic acid ligase)